MWNIEETGDKIYFIEWDSDKLTIIEKSGDKIAFIERNRDKISNIEWERDKVVFIERNRDKIVNIEENCDKLLILHTSNKTFTIEMKRNGGYNYGFYKVFKKLYK